MVVGFLEIIYILFDKNIVFLILWVINNIVVFIFFVKFKSYFCIFFCVIEFKVVKGLFKSIIFFDVKNVFKKFVFCFIFFESWDGYLYLNFLRLNVFRYFIICFLVFFFLWFLNIRGMFILFIIFF